MSDDGRRSDDAAPEMIGRFVVIRPAGRGGAGARLVAYDPRLERKVSLEPLGAGAGRDDGAEGERRGAAQAMARLQHPNVVTVYEVERDGEQEYLVTEFVEGEALGAWQRAGRSCRELVVAYVAAGRGLEAAHAAGIVHGDFGPESVVIGRDGRPRLGRFGPGLGAHAASARDDQRAFCAALLDAVEGRGAPTWVVAALRRGVAADPAARWPSMGALLDELGQRLARRRRAFVGAGVGAGALVALAVVTIGLRSRAADADPCPNAAPRLAEVWDEARAREAREAFVRTGLGYAGSTAAAAGRRLDAQRRAWIAMHEQACRATRVEGRQPDSLLDRRMECLDRWRGATAALTSLWAREADASAVEGAVAAVDALPSIEDCGDLTALAQRTPPPREPAARARVEAAAGAIDRASALGGTRRTKEAREAADAAKQAADEAGFAPQRARASLLVGFAAHRVGDEIGAVASLREAARIAASVGDDALAVEALIQMANTQGAMEGHYAEALAAADAAEVMLTRAGNPPRLRGALLLRRAMLFERTARLEEARAAVAEAEAVIDATDGPTSAPMIELMLEKGSIAWASGDLLKARDVLSRAIEVTAEALDPEHPRLAALYGDLGGLELELGDYARSLEVHERGLRILSAAQGEDSLPYATSLNNYANALVMLGRFDDAERAFRRALAIRESKLGGESPMVATVLGNLGGVYQMRGRHRDALAAQERALAIKLASYGHDHPLVANTLENMAGCHGALGAPARARALFEEAIAIRVKVQGPDHPDTLETRLRLAEQLAGGGQCDKAAPIADDVLRRLEAALGPDHVAAASAIAIFGTCDAAAGRHAAAVQRFERALAVVTKAGAATQAPSIKLSLAKALWASGGDRVRARALALEAERGAAQGEASGGDGTAAEARAWLKSR